MVGGPGPGVELRSRARHGDVALDKSRLVICNMLNMSRQQMKVMSFEDTEQTKVGIAHHWSSDSERCTWVGQFQCAAFWCLEHLSDGRVDECCDESLLPSAEHSKTDGSRCQVLKLSSSTVPNHM